MALDVSGRCNLACRYCAESATQPPRPGMAADMLERAWAWFRGGRPAGSWSVHVGSGEPLLAMPLLRRIDALARAEPRDPLQPMPVFVSTNGTRVDEATADWLVASGWDVKISIDGPRHVNDRWRVTRSGEGTFDSVERAARTLAPRLGTRMTVISVLCRGNDPAEMYGAAEAVGARRMDVIPVASGNPEFRLSASDIASYEAFILEYARRCRDGESRLAPVLGRFSRFVMRVMGYQNRRVPCGAGRDYVGVGPDGALYPCMRFVGIERYQIGQVPQGLDPAAAEAFRQGPGRPFDQRATCRSCWAAPLCGGPCFACAEMFDVERHCEIYRAEAAAAVWLVRQLRERDPARLLSFLPGFEH
jgi:uncharacterized protein